LSAHFFNSSYLTGDYFSYRLEVSATASKGQIALSWTVSSGATQYQVYRGTASDGEANAPVATTNGATTTYVDTGLTNESVYYYNVSASNGVGVSPDSNEVAVVFPNWLLRHAPNGSEFSNGGDNRLSALAIVVADEIDLKYSGAPHRRRKRGPKAAGRRLILPRHGVRPSQPIDLVDNNYVDLLGPDLFQECLQGWTLKRGAWQPTIIETVINKAPAVMRLALDIGLASFPLGVERVEGENRDYARSTCACRSRSAAQWGDRNTRQQMNCALWCKAK
jgi:hypothetical protein